jgi:mitochondrial inner membrane protease ATP23
MPMFILATGPKVVFMLDRLKQAGCNVKPSHVRCTPCNGMRVSAAAPSNGNIFLCEGNFINKSHMEDALTHELLHLYDHATFSVNWNDLRHHACSEVFAMFSNRLALELSELRTDSSRKS